MGNLNSNDDGLATREGELLATAPLLNRTDPVVIHDPIINAHVIIKDYSDISPVASPGKIKNDADLKRIEGTMIPIIRVGGLVLKFSDILYMSIDYDSFVPTIELTIQQLDKSNQIAEVPGMGCDMTVILTPHVDGAYKPINLTFYVRNIQYTTNNVTYYGVYKWMKMDEPLTKQVVFDGCTTQKCQLPQNNKPSTFEFLYSAAVNDLGLGLAATKQVKEIKDNKTRILHAENYYDAIQKHVAFGGLDEQSIFDCWVDLYRYLVIVNIPWVMNEPIKTNELGYHILQGIDITDSSISEADTESNMVPRIITNNLSLPSSNNITFRNYEFIVDNTKIQDEGAILSSIITKPTSTGGNDGCDQIDVKIEENSIDGYIMSSGYSYQKQIYLGPEYGDKENTPILSSKILHDSYLRKLRAKRLRIEMDNPNFGLQRGTLLTVLIYEYNNINKRYMISHAIDSIQPIMDEDEGPTITSEDIKDIDNNGQGILNIAISGIYYIDGMVFKYDIKYQKIIQFLYLIKKDIITNMSSIVAKPKISLAHEQ